MPALPLDEAGKYVAAAYLVFLALILIYVTIMAIRLDRLNKDLDELVELTEQDPGSQRPDARTPSTGDPRTGAAR
jgi:predicted S18 family serine protease